MYQRKFALTSCYLAFQKIYGSSILSDIHIVCVGLCNIISKTSKWNREMQTFLTEITLPERIPNGNSTLSL